MLRRDSLSDRSSCTSDCIYDEESLSVSSSTTKAGHSDKQLVIEDAENPYNATVGSISVTNSSDIHFGNRTFYQGPVTIKQFLYNTNTSSNESILSNSSDNTYEISVSETNEQIPCSVNTGDLKCATNNPTNKQTPVVIKNESKANPEERESKEGAKWFQDLPRRQVICIASIAIVLVLSLVISTALLLTNHALVNVHPVNPTTTLDEEQGIIEDQPPKGNVSFTLPEKLKINSRAEWLAQPPTHPPDNLTLPVPYVIIMHTATAPCIDQGSCIFHVRRIQMFHIEGQKWWDIGYNFLVGGDGYVYEGRGWKHEGAHTFGYNDRSIGIALIGTFTNVLPADRQLNATKKLIAMGLKEGYISKNYKLLGARQLQSTESPGTVFFEHLKSWSHWTETP